MILLGFVAAMQGFMQGELHQGKLKMQESRSLRQGKLGDVWPAVGLCP
jgi:hypothetical protein